MAWACTWMDSYYTVPRGCFVSDQMFRTSNHVLPVEYNGYRFVFLKLSKDSQNVEKTPGIYTLNLTRGMMPSI